MRTVTLHGKTFHLQGKLPTIGQPIPDVTLSDADLKPVALSSFRGKPQVIVTVPSLDTPVCQKETRHFYELLSKKPVHLLVISLDLPFAQKRFCGAEQLTQLHVLSDFKDHAFGNAFGIRIEELGLLARAVFLVDPQGKLSYAEVVPVLSDEPNYKEILSKITAQENIQAKR